MTANQEKMHAELMQHLRNGENLLQAQLNVLAKYRDDIETASEQIKADHAAGVLR